MKYIKLYEAFESETISKTIKFLNKSGAAKFKERLYNICNVYDFPYSKLNDNMFEYLPYKKAIDINKDKGVETCKQESETIKGEFCKDGKIKRTWGKGFRMVECPNCNGTGKEPVRYNLSKVKFWFDVDGNFIETTCCDGTKSKSVKLEGSFSRNKNDYDVVGFIDNVSDLNKMGNGYIYLTTFSGRDNLLVYIYNYNGIPYMFQDELSANASNSIENKISSHCVGMQDNYFNAHYRVDGKIGCEILKPKGKDKVTIKTVDINDKGVNISRYSVTPQRGFINLDSIKKAHFAIILDIDELKDIDYNKRTSTQENRTKSRENAYALMDVKSIKSANISRYVNAIIDRSKVTKDVDNIKNIKRTILRILGGQNVLFFINDNSAFNAYSQIDDVTKYLYLLIQAIGSDDSDAIETYMRYTNDKIKSSLSSVNKYNLILERKKDELVETARSKNNSESTEVLEINNMILNLSKLIYDCIKDRELSSVEDLEILVQDIGYVNSIIRGNRISLNSLRYYFNRITGAGWNEYNAYFELVKIDANKTKESIDAISSIVKRKLK